MPTPATDATVAVPPTRETPAGHPDGHGQPDGRSGTTPRAPEAVATPCAGYGQLREQAPIVRGRMPDGTAVWLVSRFDDVRELLRDPRFVHTSEAGPGRPGEERATTPAEHPAAVHRYLPAAPAEGEPPTDARLRQPVAAARSSDRLRERLPRVERIADELAAALPGHAREGVVDLLEHFAYPLPLALCGDPVDAPEDGDGGPTLPPGGVETTGHLIGNAAAALLAHPAQLAALRADPGLWPGAVEELTRWCGPVEMARLRYATEDLTFRDTRIRRGEAVRLVLAAANLDPRRHADPDRLDVTRELAAGQAEQQLGFGHGVHRCPGAAVVRQEVGAALRALAGRYPALSLAVAAAELERVALPDGRRLARLPVRLGPPA